MVQVTPPGATSFATTALTAACAPAVIVAGGCCGKEMLGGVAIVIVARPGLPAGGLLPESTFGVAETITTPSGGIAAGAVYVVLTA